MSTIESIKKVIEDLNRLGVEEADTSSFLRPFEKMIEYQIECVKSPFNNNNHSSKKKNKMREREYYKEGGQGPSFMKRKTLAT